MANNINTFLDESSLLLIFDRLSAEDLIRAGRVCSNWYGFRQKSALNRNSLKLLIGGSDVAKAEAAIADTRFDFIPFKKQILADDDDGKKKPLFLEAQNTDGDQVAKLYEKCSIKCKSFSLSEVDFLAKLFPNIQNLLVATRTHLKDLGSLTELLKRWSSNLVTLKLYTYNEVYNVNKKTSNLLTNGCNVLLKVINSLTSLRVLHLNVEANLLMPRIRQLDLLPIVGRLTEFCFYSQDVERIDEAIVNSLVSHGSANLGKISFLNPTGNLKTLVRVPSEMGSKFTDLCIEVHVENYRSLREFTQRFENLTNLLINLYWDAVDPILFYKSIHQLKQLISLCLFAEGSIICRMDLTDRDDVNFDEISNKSLKTLNLTTLTPLWNHDKIGGMRLASIFPKVQFVQFTHQNAIYVPHEKCTFCKKCYDARIEAGKFVESCLSPMVAPFGLFEDLQEVHTSKVDKIWTRDEIRRLAHL